MWRFLFPQKNILPEVPRRGENVFRWLFFRGLKCALRWALRALLVIVALVALDVCVEFVAARPYALSVLVVLLCVLCCFILLRLRRFQRR